MSASLHQRLFHERAVSAPALPRGLRLPWRDSATQQLDALEAANRRLSANRIGGNGLGIAILATVLLLIALMPSWRPAARPASPPPPTMAAATTSPLLPPLPVPVPLVAPRPLAISQPMAERTFVPEGGALAAIDEAAQQQAVRARALADARRHAARVTQERALLGKDALRATERPPQPERVAEAPAPRAAEPAAALQPVVHAVARAGVKDLCSGAGFFGQGVCQARECRKPELASDAVCVRLREADLARARSGDH